MRLYLLLGIVMAGYIVKLNGKGFLNYVLLNRTLIKFCFVNFVFSLFIYLFLLFFFWRAESFSSKIDNMNITINCESL